MSLGFLAGIGDAAHEDFLSKQKDDNDAKTAFGEQLLKVAMDEQNWSSAARTAAMQARTAILMNPKFKRTDIDKHWKSVIDASLRPDPTAIAQQQQYGQQADSLQSTSENLGTGNPSAMTHPAPQMLQPPEPQDAAMAMLSGHAQSSGLNLGGTSPALSVIGGQNQQVLPMQPISGAAQTQSNAASQQASAPVPQISGMYSPQERSQIEMQRLKSMLQSMSSDGMLPAGTSPGISVDSKGKATVTAPRRIMREGGRDYVMADGTRQYLRDFGDGKLLDRTGIDRTSEAIMTAGGAHFLREFNPETQQVELVPYDTHSAQRVPGAVSHLAPVAQHFAPTTDAAGNIFQVTSNPYTGRVTGRTQTGTQPFAGARAQHLALSNQGQAIVNQLRSATLISPEDADVLIDEENDGKMMSKVPAPIYAQMLRRREDLLHGGDPRGQLPETYGAAAQAKMSDSYSVLRETDRIQQAVNEYVAANGGVPSNMPYENAVKQLAYSMGYASEDQFSESLAQMSMLALRSGATIGAKGMRNWAYIEETLKHTPKPGKDSIELVLRKLNAIRDVNETLISAARDTGLKSGVVTQAPLGGKQPGGPPQRTHVSTTQQQPAGGGKYEKLTTDQLIALGNNDPEVVAEKKRRIRAAILRSAQ